MAIDMGSVPDWLSAIGGIGAVVGALIVADLERRRADRAEKSLRIERVRRQNELPEAFAQICERAIEALSDAHDELLLLPPPISAVGNRLSTGADAHNAIFRTLNRVFNDLDDAAAFLQGTRTHDVALRIASRDLREHFGINERYPNQPLLNVLDWLKELIGTFTASRQAFSARMAREE